MYLQKAKPFLKWAGGKTQLINDIDRLLPRNLFTRKFSYVEPFVGSGAVLFWILDKFPHLEKIVINDINEDLINTYRVIAAQPKELITVLCEFQENYHALHGEQGKKETYYYEKRILYNSRVTENVMQAALFIFLNKTCFNGLYRVNQKNHFNVPIGSYKKPTICNAENIYAVSAALRQVEILCGDYEDTLEKTGQHSFFYFDPPYKPLSSTSSFNSYAQHVFNDAEQIRLRDFCRKLETRGHQWLLSNSDPKIQGTNQTFFDDIYANFRILRVKASRRINSNAEKRGELNELLIANYEHEKTLRVIV